MKDVGCPVCRQIDLIISALPSCACACACAFKAPEITKINVDNNGGVGGSGGGICADILSDDKLNSQKEQQK